MKTAEGDECYVPNNAIIIRYDAMPSSYAKHQLVLQIIQKLVTYDWMKYEIASKYIILQEYIAMVNVVKFDWPSYHPSYQFYGMIRKTMP
jgi:hypothetical protein